MNSKFRVISDVDTDFFSYNPMKQSATKHQLCGIMILSDHTYNCKTNHSKQIPYVSSSPTPIPNLGNTCWLGAVMQALLNSDYFVRMTLDYFPFVEKKDNFPTLTAVGKFIKAYLQKNKSKVIEQTRELKEIIASENAQFNSNAQQDATEFLLGKSYKIKYKRSSRGNLDMLLIIFYT